MTESPSARPWTHAEIAEDLLAQIDEALAAGCTIESLVASLDAEGLGRSTALRLIDEVQAAMEPEASPETEATTAPERPAILGEDGQIWLSLWRLRTAMRAVDDALRIDATAVASLRAALAAAGLSPATAQAVIDEARAVERKMQLGFLARRRRLGVQGFVFGLVTTGLFVLGGLPGGAARWHWATACATAALTGYSWLLWQRSAAAMQDAPEPTAP